MRILFSLLLLIFCILSSVETYAEDLFNYYCDQISLNQGLNTVHILCANRDNTGFLWIGTEQGLHRYDGQQMKLYSATNDSVSFTRTFFITEDNQHNLWVGSDNGLLRYDSDNDIFTRLSAHKYSCSIPSDQYLYFAAADHFLRVNVNDLSIARLDYKGDITSPMYGSLRIAAKNENEFYISSGNDKVYTLNRHTAALKLFYSTRGNRITDLVVNQQGDIFISTFEAGMFHLSPQGIVKKHFETRNSILASDVIVDLHLYKDHSLWIAVDGGGVYILDLQTSHLSRLKMMSSNANNENLRTIITIQEDADKNIYLATRRTGLFVLKQNHIYSFLPAGLNSSDGPSLGALLGFIEDQKHIWMATDGNGINRFDKQAKTFKHYPETFGMRVSSLDFTDDQSILFVAYRKGLYTFNKESGQVHKEDIPQQLEQKIRTGWVCPYIKRIGDSESCLLLLDSAYIYTPSSRSVQNLSVGNNFRTDMALRLIHATDSSYTLFANQGIYEFSLKTQSLSKVLDLSKYRNEFIVSATKTVEGKYWLISNNSTVYCFDPRCEMLRPVLMPLTFKPLIVVAAKDNAIWFGSTHNICRYVPGKDQMTIYGKSDGVHENEYIDRTFLITKDDYLLLGGVNGFSLISPEIARQKQEEPIVRVISVQSNGNNLPKEAYKDHQLQLPANNETLSISFLFKGRSLFDEYFYQYKLEGVMDDFELTNKTQLAFNHIPPGTYRLKLRFSRNGRVWSEPAEALHITISPFWWHSLWIYGVVLFAVLLLLYVRYRLKKRLCIIEQEPIAMENHPDDPSPDKTDDDFLFREQLNEMITAHLSDSEFDVDKLASSLAMSRSTLYARMRQTIGIGAKEYINTMRIRQAEALLTQTELPIIEISEQVGFSHQRYFSTVFKNINGITPTEYRNVQRNQNNIV
ncbi:MAG: helix-turn-helix domain-containing protein [Bacteroidales bacterium]